ncbi:MAG: hypothetical protein AAGF73_09815 [Actinomycetota bacterium]
MSVDTNTKGKNTGVYRKIRHGGVQILITPSLVGMARSMRVVTSGMRGRKLAVEFKAAEDAPGGDGEGCCT